MRTRDFIRKYCTRDAKSYSVFSANGTAYIGLYREGHYVSGIIRFLAKHEITEIYSFNDFRKTIKSSVACCGFSKKEQRWYGWTHRGVRSFGIGDTYLHYFGGKPAKTLEECKKLAFYAVKALD